jgi:hypothetical protein
VRPSSFHTARVIRAETERGGLSFEGPQLPPKADAILDVNFQEVVHSVLTGKADVAKQVRSLGLARPCGLRPVERAVEPHIG